MSIETETIANDATLVENFYGVYLLYCKNPQYLGRTYIGFTVDPKRRLKQHNKGKKAGGAWKTSKRGPWIMVMIIHGFPNDISALRFEWAWQHPDRSRRLNHVSKKKAKEKTFDYCLRVLSEMLNVGPWKRLPLTIQWLEEEYSTEFPTGKNPPLHMPISYGPVNAKKIAKNEEEPGHHSTTTCSICNQNIETAVLTCLNNKCNLVSHVICLSKFFCQINEYVPIEGNCPNCHLTYLWSDLIRKSKGCYSNLQQNS